MNLFRRFFNLTEREKTDLIIGYIMVPVIAALLRLLGVARCQRMLARFTRQAKTMIRPPVGVARQNARMIDIAARRGIISVNCLDRSMALWWALRRMGFDSQLRIGTRKETGTFEAHAWVEVDGVVVNDSGTVADVFTPFDRSIDYLQADS